MTRMLSLEELLSPTGSWSYIVICPEEGVDSFVHGALQQHPEGAIRIVRGGRCHTASQLFQEWAAALQFPWYFGHNWDAFDECLSDLEWLRGTAYIFFVTQTDQVLRDEPEKASLLFQTLEAIAREWASPDERLESIARPNKPFRIIFHSEPANEALVRGRLSAVGLAAELRGLSPTVS